MHQIWVSSSQSHFQFFLFTLFSTNLFQFLLSMVSLRSKAHRKWLRLTTNQFYMNTRSSSKIMEPCITEILHCTYLALTILNSLLRIQNQQSCIRLFQWWECLQVLNLYEQFIFDKLEDTLEWLDPCNKKLVIPLIFIWFFLWDLRNKVLLWCMYCFW